MRKQSEKKQEAHCYFQKHKQELHEKLSKMQYDLLFSRNFHTSTIDSSLKRLDTEAKAELLENVIEIMDDKNIKANKTLNYSRSKHKLESSVKVKTARPKKMFEEAILRDPNRVTTYDPFDRLPFQTYI